MSGFGLASTVFRSRRLGEEEVAGAAEAGFESIHLVSASGHFDWSNATQLEEIVRASANAGITIGSIVTSADHLSEIVRVGPQYGVPLIIVLSGQCRVSGPSSSTGLATSLEKIADLLPSSGCSVAIQAPGGREFDADAVAELLSSLDDPRLGACLDVGHAHLAGGAPECAEALSGLVTSAFLHDNAGREDQHRAPGEGSISWPVVMTAFWKTGFAGPWIIDVAGDSGRADAGDSLKRAVGARTRLQAILDDLAQPMTFTE